VIAYLIVILYISLLAYLNVRGRRQEIDPADPSAVRPHPLKSALGYGGVFVSTAAIIGFGGAAGVYGLGLLWLVVLNIGVGIFLAFSLFGERTRRLGRVLDAHTFSELLGARYRSGFLQAFCGLLVFCAMPLYAAAVILGAAAYIGVALDIPRDLALFGFSTLIAAYAIMGGARERRSAAALQAAFVAVGMLVLLFFTYHKLGGPLAAHRALQALRDQVPEALKKAGHQGWAAFPAFGSACWWRMISTLIAAVGVGALAQPQLVTRFFSARGGGELKRAVAPGAVFILAVAGSAFTVGALSNVYFARNPDRIEFARVLRKGGGETMLKEVAPRSDASALEACGGNVEEIIPRFVRHALPRWFTLLFLLALLSAALSTLRAQFLTAGISFGRDFYERGLRGGKRSPPAGAVSRMGMVAAILLSVGTAYVLPREFSGRGLEIVARATAAFFGFCAAAFLPVFAGGYFYRRSTRAGAIASVAAGAVVYLFWLLLCHRPISGFLPMSTACFGAPSLVSALRSGFILWEEVDPILIALPVSLLVLIAVSAATRPFPREHLRRCLGR